MSDSTTPPSSDVDEAASIDAKSEKVAITGQLKAPKAGRTPLPDSRPKRKLDEMESSESGESADSSTLEGDTESAEIVDGSHGDSDKENTMAGHAAKKPKVKDAKTSRTQWSQPEICLVITMRRNKASWQQIHNHFPGRTLVGVRQIFWKYNKSYTRP